MPELGTSGSAGGAAGGILWESPTGHEGGNAGHSQETTYRLIVSALSRPKDFAPAYDFPDFLGRLTGAVGSNLPYGATADCSNGYCYDALGNIHVRLSPVTGRVDEPQCSMKRRTPGGPHASVEPI